MIRHYSLFQHWRVEPIVGSHPGVVVMVLVKRREEEPEASVEVGEVERHDDELGHLGRPAAAVEHVFEFLEH